MLDPGRVAHGQVVDGRYQLVALVAEGEHGELWRGELRGASGFARPVAIKVVPRSLFIDRIDPARFLARARRSVVLEHPNIVQVHDLARDRVGHYHLVSEWVEGLSLRQLVRGVERLGLRTPWPVAVAIGIGVLRGVASAHAHRDVDGDDDPVLHGGLSPDRVMIGVNGIAKLGGYGMLGAAGPRTRTAADVLAYQAPEVALRVGWSESADVYGVAAVLWHALTGVPPCGADLDQAVAYHAGEAILPSLSQMRVGMPPRLIATIDRALAFEATDRFTSADAMAAELTPLLAGVPWMSGPQADLGRAVSEARAALHHPARGTDSNDLFGVSAADIVESIDLPEGTPEHPILLTRKVRGSSQPGA